RQKRRALFDPPCWNNSLVVTLGIRAPTRVFRRAMPNMTKEMVLIGVLAASDPGEKIGELFLDLAPQFGARPRNAGKIRQALEWPAGVDDGARIGRAQLVGQRIERSAPGPAHEFDVACRIAARAYRPHHVQ